MAMIIATATNEKIVSKWTQELEGASFFLSAFGKGAFQFVLKHLTFKDFYIIQIINHKSDNLVEKEIKLELIDQPSRKFFSQNKPDYHLNSNEQVLDLVHPSVDGFVFSETLVTAEVKQLLIVTKILNKSKKKKKKIKLKVKIIVSYTFCS